MAVDIKKAKTANDIKNGVGTIYTPNKPQQFATQPTVRKIFDATDSWTCPDDVNTILVECWGGGGAGSTRTGSGAGSGGGGAGAYVSSRLTVTPGQSYTVTVGAAANDSWFSAATTILAKGGTNGSANAATGASGGSADSSIGEIKIAGGDGGAADTEESGYGGVAPMGGGLGGAAVYSAPGANSTGVTGSAPGGGGSGAWKNTAGNPTGGAGAAGRVVLTYVSLQAEITSPEIATIENKYTDKFDDAGYYA